MKEFKDLVFSFTDYTKEMLTEFFDYWSEPNKKGKMRWELEKTWDVSRRLKRWFDNQKKWNADSKVRNRVDDLHEYARRHD